MAKSDIEYNKVCNPRIDATAHFADAKPLGTEAMAEQLHRAKVRTLAAIHYNKG